VALPQPERSELNSTIGGTAPVASLADAYAGAPPGAVWLTICAWCARVKARDRWVDSQFALELIGREPRLTHGICPECFDDVTASASRDRRARNAS
jgi:hypothetical protein